jgi:hypothetical protein
MDCGRISVTHRNRHCRFSLPATLCSVAVALAIPALLFALERPETRHERATHLLNVALAEPSKVCQQHRPQSLTNTRKI